MPFAFWKASSSATAADTDATSTPLLSGGATTLDLDPGARESGAFTFEDMEQLAHSLPGGPSKAVAAAAACAEGSAGEDAPLLQDDEQIETHGWTEERDAVDEVAAPRVEIQSMKEPLPAAIPAETPPVEDTAAPEPSPASPEEAGLCSRDVDFPVSSDSCDASTRIRPTFALPPQQGVQQVRPSSFSIRRPSSTTPQRTDSTTTRRLHRPTELNLSTTPNAAKPQTELEKRFDLMRNSKTQSRAALRSPTQLLKERLNMSPRKSTYAADETVRVFVPPRPSSDGCLLPGPAGRAEAFTSSSVRARTGTGRPAWWCKFDKLVVFDGVEGEDGGGEVKLITRTSKGLSVARRRGQTETIVVPMGCAHCQEMLNRHEWKYDIQVCRRSVCWDCKERCKWEQEQERSEQAKQSAARLEANRDRADSMLQDDDVCEKDSMREMVIEEGRLGSSMEGVGGIEERLGTMLC